LQQVNASTGIVSFFLDRHGGMEERQSLYVRRRRSLFLF
jgi:hypothetical protein